MMKTTLASSVVLVSTALGGASPPTNGTIRAAVIIDRQSAPWQSQQVQEPCILPNRKDPTRLVMFYSGVRATNRSICYIGTAWALKSDPLTWHQDPANPVLAPSKDGWDSKSIRLDAVLYLAEEDAYCTAPVLAPEAAEPFAETMASQAAVLRERDAPAQRWTWFMYCSYRGKNGTLPGIRLATSTDGKTWRRQFNEKDPRGMGHLFVSTPNAKWGDLYRDRTIFHVATPAFYQIEGQWYLYVQACPLPANRNYIDGHWDLWGFVCDREIATLPGHRKLFIPGSSTPSRRINKTASPAVAVPGK